MNELLVDLLVRCKERDRDAIAELIRRFRYWATDFATAVLDDKDLAEDAVQDAFIVALEKLNELREPKAFPGWFRSIIRTSALRISRSRHELSWDDNVEPQMADASENKLRLDELHEQVRAAMEALPKSERETTELFYFNEMSCSEISNTLCVPQGTVRRRLHDSRKRLKSMLLGYISPEPAEDYEKARDKSIPL